MSKTWDWFYEDDEEEVAEMEDLEEEFEEEDLEEEFEEDFEEEFEDEFDEEFEDELEPDEYGDEPDEERRMQAGNTPNRASVYFEYKSTTVPAGGLNLLQFHAQYLMANPDEVIRLEGHTDSVASGQYNKRLAMRRAQAVAQILIQMGVSSSQIEAISHGEEKPATSENNPQSSALNRRVELVY